MSAPLLEVTAQEAGQKLLQFIRRRLATEVPQSALMRWIRTGQVRVDKGRAKPYQRLEAGQRVRLPPQAAASLRQEPAAAASPSGAFVPLLHQEADLLVCIKPAGLPVHGGSGQADSLHARLQAMFPDAPFAPTPAHRLDKDTSGLLLAALSYTRLRELQERFAHGEVRKEYLAWVAGEWQVSGVCLLHDQLEKTGAPGSERMRTGAGKQALAWAMPVAARNTSRGRCSLLLLRLGTGRTHQLRVQLAARGHAIVGDAKYGGPKCAQGMLLHAFRLEIAGKCFTLPAPWSGEFAPPDALPPPITPPCLGHEEHP